MAKLFTQRILGLAWFVLNRILVAIGADSHIKLYDVEKKIILGGGTLAQRLKGSTLTCMEVEPSSKRVYIGTDKDVVLVYGITAGTYRVKYVMTITLTGWQSPVTTLLLAQEYFLSLTV